MLPMRPGQPVRRRHDYTKHGTTSLFAALDIATGRVIGKCYGRHRAAEFRKFLDEIEAAVPRELDVHLVIDNWRQRRHSGRADDARAAASEQGYRSAMGIIAWRGATSAIGWKRPVRGRSSSMRSATPR